MLNTIPIIGWLLDLLVKISLALPFWVIWTLGGIGETYFDFLPTQFHAIPFWHCVGIFITVPIIKLIFVPKFVSVDQSVEKK